MLNPDILITGAHVIDPTRKVDEIADVRIVGDAIIDPKTPVTSATMNIDARGYYLFPGLIDFHAHVFSQGTEYGVPADLATLPFGVTTVVDAGSAGSANYELFHRQIISQSQVRIKSFLAVSSPGQTWDEENQDPAKYDIEKIKMLFRRYPDNLAGLKLKQERGVVGELGVEPMRASVAVAEALGCPVAVHTTDPVIPADELARLFRPGDIYAHAFHGKGSTIIGADGHVLAGILEARRRGVIFDCAHGRSHFSLKTAGRAIGEGFYPDVISSDLSRFSFNKAPAFNLPWVMSKLLALGMPLYDIVAAVTATPARLLNLSFDIGTLAPGACADVALFRLAAGRPVFEDIHGESLVGENLLIPQITWRAGEMVYRQNGFAPLN
ncbi:metallo-dependent hydrolase [Martelella alba]|uniref:Metallo-dependent hydrolase n=1 Tax=Martelella alba TaxID=2590451 RepID=A0ABY2SIF0_9HYPH|nr:metallo-dependent hydrolase [Martelella alba]TKI05179.1 metallo-dependent hydrolase [Martelella alba]